MTTVTPVSAIVNKKPEKYFFSDNVYHSKQKNPQKSYNEEFVQYRKELLPILEEKSFSMINEEDVDIYKEAQPRLSYYRENYENFLYNGKHVKESAIKSDPFLNKIQKHYYEKMMSINLSNSSSSLHLKNATTYTPAGVKPQFMIRALSYIYPLLIVSPLPELSWREDWPVDSGGGWSDFAVIIGATRIYPQLNTGETNVSASPSVVQSATTSPNVGAEWGEQRLKVMTLRNDIVWDSTILKYQDETLNNGLVNFMYLKSLQRGVEEQINSIYLYGAAEYDMQGLLNNGYVPLVPSTGPWAATNPLNNELYATSDILTLMSAVTKKSKKAFNTSNVMMSLELFDVVTRPRSYAVSSSPISQNLGQFSAVKAYNSLYEPLQRCQYNPYFDNAGTDGKQVALAYDKNIINAKIGLPVPLMAEPISYENNRYRMPFVTRTYGFALIQPQSMAIMKDIEIEAAP